MTNQMNNQMTPHELASTLARAEEEILENSIQLALSRSIPDNPITDVLYDEWWEVFDSQSDYLQLLKGR